MALLLHLLLGVLSDAPLMDKGLDSLGAVELRSSLETKLDMQLPATLVFDYPSVDAIIKYINSVATETIAGVTADDSVDIPSLPANHMSMSTALQAQNVIVVSATACSLPGKPCNGSMCGGEWQLNDAIRIVPADRWDVELSLTDDMPGRFGAFLESIQVSALVVACASGLLQSHQLVCCTHQPWQCSCSTDICANNECTAAALAMHT